MPSPRASPINLVDDDDIQAPAVPPPVVPNVLAAMMRKPAPEVAADSKMLRDRCRRPEPQYNTYYNPHEPHNESLKEDYSPYDFGEPLFDDRKPYPSRFPGGMVLAGASKKPRTLWVWKLGYALQNTRKAHKPIYWCCKLCMYTLLNLKNQELTSKVIMMRILVGIWIFNSPPTPLIMQSGTFTKSTCWRKEEIYGDKRVLLSSHKPLVLSMARTIRSYHFDSKSSVMPS